MKILLVDDEEQVLRGVSRMIECEMDDWEVETASDGNEALELLGTEHFNVIVSDMRMPGMDGAELLQQVEARFPQVLRVVLSGQADRDSVLRAVKPMHQYLAKPCDPDTLIEVIQRAEVLQDTISSTEVLEAIGQANCLPTIPRLLTQFNKALESDDCDSNHIAYIVSRDPVLCARILQLTNSAIFGLNQVVTDIDKAVSVVGFEMIRSLILAKEFFGDSAQGHSGLVNEMFEHSFEVATRARAIAELCECTNEEANSAFTAGLLHDVGKLILINAFGERYVDLLSETDPSNASLCKNELERFGVAHNGVGAFLLQLWGLPLELIKGVASHHSFEQCMEGSVVQKAVFAANWIADDAEPESLDSSAADCNDKNAAQNFAAQIKDWYCEVSETNS